MIRTATLDDLKLVLQLSRKSPYTRSLPRFVEQYFINGEVGISLLKGKILGFVLVRHCIKLPYTSLYDLGVDPDNKLTGVGSSLVKWVEEVTPHREIRLVVDCTNSAAILFWKKKGFVEWGRKETKSKHILIQMKKAVKNKTKKELW